MRVLYFDCFSGISGDMALGALLDLGIDKEVFIKELSRLRLDGYKIEISTKMVNGIKGTDVNVVLTDDGIGHKLSECGNTNEAPHGNGHGEHHENPNGTPHGERGLPEIEMILDRSMLSEYVKGFSKKVFREIAAAEARVHDKPINEVHFHEVGAVDSIVDIAGTAICLELLGVDKVYSSVLHDGSGLIECRHGTIPVPVPAVLEMLKGSGIPLISEEAGTELVTPTGMGLIKCMAEGFGKKPPMTVEMVGYGFGKRNTGRFNALRIILGETNEGSVEKLGSKKHEDEIAIDEIVILETNIDDTTSEILGYTMSKLMEAGALDAYYTPVFMKKNRPAYMLTVLAAPGTEALLAQIILRETSTLGIRKGYMKRICMERRTLTVNTPYGEARIKVAKLGSIKKATPEYEDCKKMAEAYDLPLAEVYKMVAEAVHNTNLLELEM